MLTITRLNELDNTKPIFQLRRGEPCEEFGVWACPLVLTLGYTPQGQLAVHYGLPNERHWKQWRTAAEHQLHRLQTQHSSEKALVRAITHLVNAPVDSNSLWHWTSREEQAVFSQRFDKSSALPAIDQPEEAKATRSSLIAINRVTGLTLLLIVLLFVVDYIS